MSKFLSGQWNAICDRCGLEFKSGKLRKDWQGLMVDAKCYEQRHPQDLLRVRPERAIPTWTRPYSEAFLLNTTFSDMLSFYPDTTSGQDYIDPSYFLEDYIGSRVRLTVTFLRIFNDATTLTETILVESNKTASDSISLTETVITESQIERTFSDATSFSESGYLTTQDYTAPDYFLEDFLGISVTF